MSATWAWSSSSRSNNMPPVTAASTSVQNSHGGIQRLDGRLISAGHLESITDARLGHDQLRSHGVLLDLATQVGHVHAQILLRVAERAPPHRVEQLLVRERAAGLRDERPQKLPLDRREMDGCVAATQCAR